MGMLWVVIIVFVAVPILITLWATAKWRMNKPKSPWPQVLIASSGLITFLGLITFVGLNA